MLRARDLYKSFGSLAILKGVNFSLAPGERVGLIGPNGAGKSTLVNILTGKMREDSGSIVLRDSEIQKYPPEKRVKQGLVQTHQINSLLLENSVRENVALTIAERRGYGWSAIRYRKKWRRCLEETDGQLERIGLAGDAQVGAGQLSYGQKRLLEIAMALALEPAVLVLDEPTAGVSAGEVELILSVLSELPADIAVLIIEHDTEVLIRIVDALMVMMEGRIILRGEPKAVLADGRVQESYLGL